MLMVVKLPMRRFMTFAFSALLKALMNVTIRVKTNDTMLKAVKCS